MNRESQYIQSLGENVFVDFKKAIANQLVLNKFMSSPVTDFFNVKIIKSRWCPDDDLTKFEEPASEVQDMKEYRLMKECSPVPRLVLVEFRENRDTDPIIGNIYPPTGDFHQRGLVMDLYNGEILYPGTTFIENADPADIELFASDPFFKSTLQKPIEGANVTFFLDKTDNNIYISTNRRALKFSKVFHLKGSKWNFYGKTSVEETQGSFSMMNREFNIHGMAMEVLINAVVEHVGYEIPSNDGSLCEKLEHLVRTVIFGIDPNVVISGIVSYKSFASQSKTIDREDQLRITFTPTLVARRSFNRETATTSWEQIHDVNIADVIFGDYSLPLYKFIVDCSVNEYCRQVEAQNPNTHPMLLPIEDLILTLEMEPNGRRRILRTISHQTRFRERVINGSDSEERALITSLFPKHRGRNFANPLNIKERVQQIYSLATKTTDKAFAFDTVNLIGTETAINLANNISSHMLLRISTDDNLSNIYKHWVDIAFPIAEFWGESNVDKYNPNKEETSRIMKEPSNTRLCNALTTLYACSSETLRPVIVEAIAEIWTWRLQVAYLGFLPERAYQNFENAFFANKPDGNNPLTEKLPISVHKMRILRNTSSLNNPSNGVRKYRLASMISKASFLDISFMHAIYPH